MKLPLLYPEPYLASFTLRNKKPSHSSSGKTSSEFDFLEIKIKEKKKWEGKAEQSSMYYFLKNYTKFVSLQKLPRDIPSFLDCFGDKKSYQKHQNLT